MLVPDVNVLLYAVDSTSPHHARCHHWLTAALNGQEPVGFAWLVLLGFVRIASNPRVFVTPLTHVQAMDYVDQWLAQPPSRILEPTPGHAGVLRNLLNAGWRNSNSVSDAHLAAMAIEQGAQLCSCDADFARFPGLQWLDPRAVP
jgi:toxin-antitoxin system PIN domain toxin